MKKYSGFVTTMAVAVFVTVFLLPFPANAQIKAGSLELSLFAGYNIFEQKQNLNDGLIFGGRIGYNFTKHFSLEGSVEFINSSVDDEALIGGGGKEGQFRSPIDNVDLTFYRIDAVFHFMPDRSINPFVFVGSGGVHYDPKISDHDMSTFDAGVGANFWVADRFAIRIDLRDTMVTEIFPFEKAYFNAEATAGLVIAFGGK